MTLGDRRGADEIVLRGHRASTASPVAATPSTLVTIVAPTTTQRPGLKGKPYRIPIATLSTFALKSRGPTGDNFDCRTTMTESILVYYRGFQFARRNTVVRCVYLSVRRVELVNPGGGKGTRGIFFPINSIDREDSEECIVADRVQVCLRDDSAVIFGPLRLRSFDTRSTVSESF